MAPSGGDVSTDTQTKTTGTELIALELISVIILSAEFHDGYFIPCVTHGLVEIGSRIVICGRLGTCCVFFNYYYFT